MEEGMIQAQAMAARIACARMTMLDLTELRAGDGEGAALEMEKHLRVLLFMRRLALPSGKVIAIEAAT
jgi:hypothetical protein